MKMPFRPKYTVKSSKTKGIENQLESTQVFLCYLFLANSHQLLAITIRTNDFLASYHIFFHPNFSLNETFYFYNPIAFGLIALQIKNGIFSLEKIRRRAPPAKLFLYFFTVYLQSRRLHLSVYFSPICFFLVFSLANFDYYIEKLTLSRRKKHIEMLFPLRCLSSSAFFVIFDFFAINFPFSLFFIIRHFVTHFKHNNEHSSMGEEKKVFFDVALLHLRL